jgi:multiple sugar transport system substrate-binding protein
MRFPINQHKYKGALLVLVLSSVVLAGCGGNDSSSSSSSGVSSSTSSASSSSASSSYSSYDSSSYGDPTSLSATVTFWTTTGKANADSLDNLINAFNKIYPNITIDAEPQGGYTDIEDKIEKAIVAGTTPTMAYCYPDHVANYIAANDAVIDLEPYVEDPVIGFTEAAAADEGEHTDTDGNLVYGADDYVSGYWNEGKAYQVDGLYSVPFSKSTEALYYNETIFSAMGYQVPETWDEMWALCAQINNDFSGEKVGLGYDSDSNLFITLCQQRGIPYTSSSGDHYLFSNDEAKAMVTELKGYYDEGYLLTKNSTPNNAYASDAFTAGSTLMCISSTGGTSYQDTTNFTVGVAKPPKTAGSDLQVISQGPSVCVFSRATQAQKYAAWLFYKYCTRAIQSAGFAVDSTGYDPVRESSYSTDVYTEWLSENETTLYGATAAITGSMRENYFYSPVFVGSSMAREQVGGILGNVLLDTMTVDDAFYYAIQQCVTSE